MELVAKFGVAAEARAWQIDDETMKPRHPHEDAQRQGSGAKPYQTVIDLNEPAFKCSCPSRNFPCKHALGLFQDLASKLAAFAVPSFACSPDVFPDLMAATIERRNIVQWAADRSIVGAR